jgi:hypothetical protein
LVTSALAYQAQRRRLWLDLARSLHHELTTGEVAEARDPLGTLVYADDSSKVDPEVGRTAYFTVLWCFERIWAGREAIIRDYRPSEPRIIRAFLSCLDRVAPQRSQVLRDRRRQPLRFLDELIAWHVETLGYVLPIAKAELGKRLGDRISDGSSLRGLTKLMQAVLSAEQRNTLQTDLAAKGVTAFDTLDPATTDPPLPH